MLRDFDAVGWFTLMTTVRRIKKISSSFLLSPIRREVDHNQEISANDGLQRFVLDSGVGGPRMRFPFGHAVEAGGNLSRQRSLRSVQEGKSKKLYLISRVQTWQMECHLRQRG